MKLVTILILPQALNKLRDALTLLDVPGITTTEVKIKNTCHRCGTCPKENWHAMTQLEVAVADDMVEQVTRCVLDVIGRSGKNSGEQVIISPIEQVFRVRTEEYGEHAL